MILFAIWPNEYVTGSKEYLYNSLQKHKIYDTVLFSLKDRFNFWTIYKTIFKI